MTIPERPIAAQIVKGGRYWTIPGNVGRKNQFTAQKKHIVNSAHFHIVSSELLPLVDGTLFSERQLSFTSTVVRVLTLIDLLPLVDGFCRITTRRVKLTVPTSR